MLYPQDGYWRLRPLAPAGMAPTAFGSSFLIGPVEIDGRPIVRIKEVAFDPKARTFTLAFERGGSATVKMATTDQNRNVLDVAFDKPVDGRPFAALRSMYVTEFNNDVARIAVREKGARGLARGRHHDLQARHRHRCLGRPHDAVAAQHQRPRHGLQRLCERQGRRLPGRRKIAAAEHLRLKNCDPGRCSGDLSGRSPHAPSLTFSSGNQWLGYRRSIMLAEDGREIICLPL